MTRKIFLILTFLLLTQCGYETIYSSKNTKFYIKEITLEGDIKIGRQIKNGLSLFEKNKNDVVEEFKVLVKAEVFKNVSSKDKQGNPKTFNLIINTLITFVDENNVKNNKLFSESIIYNNDDNKFSLKVYEDTLKENLTEKIIDNILLYIQNISSSKSNASLTGNIGYTYKKQ